LPRGEDTFTGGQGPISSESRARLLQPFARARSSPARRRSTIGTSKRLSDRFAGRKAGARWREACFIFNSNPEAKGEIRVRDKQIKELREEQTQHHQLMTEKRELVEDMSALIASWIDVFEMQQNDSGAWMFDPKQSDLWNAHEALYAEHTALIKRWNKYGAIFLRTIEKRDIGRPLPRARRRAIRC
jgi:hypothetical protein